MDAKLSRTLADFIRHSVPTLQAAEVLLFFAHHRDRVFTAEEIVSAIRPFVATVPTVQEYVRLFMDSGLVAAIRQDMSTLRRHRLSKRRSANWDTLSMNGP